MDAAFSIAETIVDTNYDALPAELVEVTKKQVLDTIAVTLAGSTAPGIAELVEIVRDWGGKPESTVVANSLAVPAPNAAQANASMAHALDYDDTHDIALFHPSVAVVPACFAVAERMGGIKGRDLITAVALGVDISSRISLAHRFTILDPEGGWHHTATCGFFSSAAAAGKIMGLNQGAMVNAMGIAYHQAAGNSQCIIDGALTKRMGIGFAAKGGITAVLMAEKGITGAHNCFEGAKGLYNLYDKAAPYAERLTKGLGKTFEGLNVSFKPYPCCRINHPFIDATLALVAQHNIMPEDVDSVIAFHGDASRLLCEPLDVKQSPRTTVDAQFSIPWTVATSISFRKVAIKDFTEKALQNSTVRGLAQRVQPTLNPELSRKKELEPAVVEIKTRDGRTLSGRVDYPLGSPQNPVSYDDLEEKFRDCAEYAAKEISTTNLDRVLEMMRNLEDVEDVSQLICLLA